MKSLTLVLFQKTGDNQFLCLYQKVKCTQLLRYSCHKFDESCDKAFLKDDTKEDNSKNRPGS